MKRKVLIEIISRDVEFLANLIIFPYYIDKYRYFIIILILFDTILLKIILIFINLFIIIKDI